MLLWWNFQIKEIIGSQARWLIEHLPAGRQLLPPIGFCSILTALCTDHNGYSDCPNAKPETIVKILNSNTTNDKTTTCTSDGLFRKFGKWTNNPKF